MISVCALGCSIYTRHGRDCIGGVSEISNSELYETQTRVSLRAEGDVLAFSIIPLTNHLC